MPGDYAGLHDLVRRPAMSAEERLKALEQLYLQGASASDGYTVSVETLLDVLVTLYDECTNSTLRKEKNISDFVEFGKFHVTLQIRHL